MAIGIRTGAGANRVEELNTRFILKKFGAERAAYRLQWIREPHLLTDITQTNANHVSAGSAGWRYVMLDGVPSDVLSRRHSGYLRTRFSRNFRFGHPAHTGYKTCSPERMGTLALRRIPYSRAEFLHTICPGEGEQGEAGAVYRSE